MREAFGVPKTLGLFPGRVTYVIDKDGIVRFVFRSQFHAAKHVSEALRVLRENPSARFCCQETGTPWSSPSES